MTKFFILLLAFALADAEELDDFAAYRRQALSPHRAEYDRIIAAYADDPILLAFRERLELIDRLAAELVNSFESSEEASFDDVLDGMLDVEELPLAETEQDQNVTALEIYSEFSNQFVSNLQPPAVSHEELQLLRQYYDKSARAVAQYIAEHGRLIAKVDDEAAERMVQLYLVVPFLHHPDGRWSGKQIGQIPAWMQQPRYLTSMEMFALRVLRPHSAYQFARFLRDQNSDAGEPVTYLDYLVSTSERMLEAQDMHAAFHCLRVAIDQADNQNKKELVIDLRIKYAKILSDVGHAKLAAEAVKPSLIEPAEATTYGKFAMLRLKYLYKAKQFDQIAKEQGPYQADERCRPYLPQILYIAWASCRHADPNDQAEKLRQAFLKRFPEHALAAKVYFATALSALSATDYEEASRLLEIIEYRFPKSKLIAKVKDIQSRLVELDRK